MPDGELLSGGVAVPPDSVRGAAHSLRGLMDTSDVGPLGPPRSHVIA